MALVFCKEQLLLYPVTDRAWLRGRDFLSQIEEALQNGATMLQLREKDLDFDTFLEEAVAVRELTEKYHVPLIINDEIEIAVACGADGVHVGQSDMDTLDVRGILGQDKIIGVSVHTAEQAKIAEASGADYLGVGAVFATSTKKDAHAVSREELLRITKAVSIPAVGIGGIGEGNLLELSKTGLCGAAVISAIFDNEDVGKATARLYALCRRAFAE